MATQKAFASYQEIMDLHTESDTVTAIGIHTPQGDTPRKMFGGFFDQFKKFKYIGASVTLVPAARLPVDPLGVSYEAGEPTIDPRDVLNPILFHGCHGNDMGSILNKLYGNPTYEDASDSTDILLGSEATQIDDYVGTMQRLYYMALTDNTWRKAHPQKGFRKSGLRPLVYSLASTRQIAPGSIVTGLADAYDVMGARLADNDGSLGIGGDPDDGAPSGTGYLTGVNYQSPQFITPRLTSLGWLDTRNVLQKPHMITDPISSSEIGDASFETQLALATQNDVQLPKIFMGIILLPPAYKTEQYFRMIVNHHFAFKGFRGISLRNDQVGNGQLPGNVINANGGYDDSNSGWIEGDIPFEPSPDPPSPSYGDITSASLVAENTTTSTLYIKSVSYVIGESSIRGTFSTKLSGLSTVTVSLSTGLPLSGVAVGSVVVLTVTYTVGSTTGTSQTATFEGTYDGSSSLSWSVDLP